ncbi:hypothetical protein RHMOL_Rhmol11G0246000 [Rhododendron molle]|uniref:Uncharacterized protein n=1 Tax=Rhododendron molle TaxID=49168 RepID=A0ACC0LXU1_RHOML|nr:hypothetical protein RHMOL_Rhmol11G0246000 [Rhododendron molle]
MSTSFENSQNLDFDKDGCLVIKTQKTISDFEVGERSHYHWIKFDGLANAKKVWTVLSGLKPGYVPQMTPVLQCGDGIFIGVMICGSTLGDAVKTKPDVFFDKFDRKDFNLKVEKKKVQPSIFYIKVIKSAIKSSWRQ